MQRIRSIIGLFALAAFALRCLLPMGFMLTPSQGAGDTLLGLKIVICTGHGPVTYGPDRAGLVPAAPKPTSPTASNDLCPFAGQGTLASTISAPAPLETTIRYAEIVYTLTSQLYAATPRPGPTSARGPPTTTA